MSKRLIVVLTLLVILGVGLFWFGSSSLQSTAQIPVKEKISPSPSSSSLISALKIPLTIGTYTLQVELADTAAKRTQGLSGKERIEEDEGMLFLFDNPVIASFWMKDMNFPIDIIWIDEEKRIIGWEETVEPSTYPAVFSPKGEVLYALEVNAGWAKRAGLAIGQKMQF